MLPLALALGLVVILAVGRGAEVRAQTAPEPPKKLPPGPTGPTTVELERKRLIIKKGFLIAEDKLRAFTTARRIATTPQKIKKTVALYFRARNIPLEKPDPQQPFWQQTERQIADQVSEAVNYFMSSLKAVPEGTSAGYHRPGHRY